MKNTKYNDILEIAANLAVVIVLVSAVIIS